MARTSTTARRLRLLAEDDEDLKVISAALQDAVLKMGDIVYEGGSRRLTLTFNRFRWEGLGGKGGERVRSALQIGGVLNVQTRRLRRDAPDGVVALLAISFEAAPAGEENPGGVMVFQFAGGGDLRAQVECVDAIMADVSDPWPTPRRPGHH